MQLDPKSLNEQLHAFGEGICDPSIPRNAHGYQGRVRFKKVIPGVVVEALEGAEAGQEFIIDPTEFTEHGDVFARQYVTVGRKSGSSFGEFVAKLVPFALGGGAGPVGGIGLDLLKGLFGKALALLLFLALAGAALAADVAVWFSPHGGCTDEAVHEIGAARKTLVMFAYNFTSQPIADALVAAKKRGVDVRLVVDRSQRHERGALSGFCASKGIPVALDARHPIMHTKCMVIDGSVVLTGSFNWSAAAERNTENLLRIPDPALAAKYEANWREHRAHSEEW